MIRKRILSFKYAFKGIGIVAGSEINFQIHLIAVVVVLFLGFLFHITTGEWFILLLCFAVVLAAEAFNSAIEKLVDFVSPNIHPQAGKIKDIAAGGVLITAIIAAIIGGIIFIPKISMLFD